MVHSRVLVLLLLAGCTDALLQPVAVEETALDDRLSIRGKVCTGTPSPANFPVKVVFLVDKSGSMCVSDGPGSQDDNGFCQQVADRLGIAADYRRAHVKAEDLAALPAVAGNAEAQALAGEILEIINDGV